MRKRAALYSDEQLEIATCADGEDCDPHLNPGHHIKILMDSWALRALERAAKVIDRNFGVTHTRLVFDLREIKRLAEKEAARESGKSSDDDE